MVDVESDRERLSRWYRNTVTRLEPDKIVVQHLQANDRAVTVTSLSVGTDSDPQSTISEILSAIEGDAGGLSGVQRYQVVARKDAERLSRLPLRIIGGNGDENDEAIDSEPANADGLVAQLMRHLEVKERMHTRSWGQVIVTMQRLISRLQEQYEGSEDQRIAATKVAEQVLSRQFERDAMARMVSENADSKRQMFGVVRELVPYFAAFAMAKNGGPGQQPAMSAPGGAAAPAPDAMSANVPRGAGPTTESTAPSAEATLGTMVGGLFQSLSIDQMQSFFTMLDPKQQGLVNDIIQAHATTAVTPEASA